MHVMQHIEFDLFLLYPINSAPPSEPINLNVTDIGSDTITLSMKNPSFNGVPPFSIFMVELVQTTDPSPVMTRNVSTSNTDPSFTNTLVLDRLQPDTNYSVRVRAVSTHPAVGDLLGTWSSAVTFVTMSGGKWSDS